MSTVSIEINESNLVKNLGYAFSNSTTVLSEMMQNSRRSNAGAIKFYYEDDKAILTVIDDGDGIADMQKLLTLADSGWSDEVVKNDRPFGMGWFSVIYASERVIVNSMGSEIDFTTKDVLDFGEVEVKTINSGYVGTIMELHGFTLGDGMQSVRKLLDEALRKFASGFPIRVYLNDHEYARPNALDSDMTFHGYHPVGDISIAGMPGMSTKRASTSIVAYLQGLPVFTNHHRGFCNEPNIVHLNSEIFDARLPDRDKLINEADNKKIIFRRIRSEWRDYLSNLIFAGNCDELVNDWYMVMRDFELLELLNHVDTIPPSALSEVGNYPKYHVHCDNDCGLNRSHKAITRDMAESGEVTLVKRINMTPETSIQWMMMFKRDNFYFLDCSSLAKDHWANLHALDWLDVKPVITPLGDVEVKQFNGEWLDGSCTFCNSYRISIGAHTVEIHDASLGYGEHYEGSDFVVPLNDRGGEVVSHVSAFIGDHDDVDDRARDREEELFSLFVRFHRESSPSDVIQSLISDASLGRFAGLDGTYTITVTGHNIDVIPVAA